MTWDELRGRADKLVGDLRELRNHPIHVSPENEPAVQEAFDRLDADLDKLNRVAPRPCGE